MKEDFDLYTAKVIDIEDKDKQGKIKIRILPEQENVEESVLPWAMPFVTHLSSNTLENDLPEVDSTIRVLVDSTWKRFFYLQNRYFYGIYDFNKISDKLGSMSVDSDYKSIHFRMYSDGGLSFHNDKDGSHGFIQSTGSYVLFDKNGSLVSKIGKDIKIEQDGDLSILSQKSIELGSKGTDLVTIGNAVGTLGEILTTLMDNLSQLQTVGSPATHTSPKLTAQMKVLIQKTKQIFKS